MIVKVNHNDKFLAKKVLLSVVAAGVMTGFVMNAEAAEGKFSGNQVFNKTNVTYEKVNASGEANVTLTNGVVTGLKESRFDPDDPEDAGRTHADVATEIRDAGTRVEANNIAFTGEVSAVEGSNVIINGGSVTAGNAYYDAAHGNKVEKLATEIGAHDGATIELNKVKIDSNLGAFDGGVVTVNDSSVNAAFAIYAEGKGTINLISTDGKATYTVGEDGVEAADGGVINIKGGTLHTSNISVEGNGSKFITDGSVEAQKIVAGSNASVSLNGGGKITGYKYDDGNTLAASVTGNSTLTATNVDFTGDFKAKEGSKIILKGGSVTASDYYENGKKDGYTEFGAIGANSIIEADGVDIKSATLATDGAKVTIKNSNINTVEGIWAWNEEKVGKGSVIVLDGTAANVYTVGESIVAYNGGKIYINGGTLKDDNLKSKMFGIKVEGGTINTDTKGIVLDKNGVISTMSKQIFEHAANAKTEAVGEITNNGIDFQGGTLSLNDAEYTLAYANDAGSKVGPTNVVMTGKLAGSADGKVSVGAASKVGDKVALDQVTATTTEKNLLVGSTSGRATNVDGIEVKEKVQNGFSVGSLELAAGSTGVVITNAENVTLGGSAGGDVISVVGESNPSVKVVVGTTDLVAGTNSKAGSLTIGNALATADTKLHLKAKLSLTKTVS